MGRKAYFVGEDSFGRPTFRAAAGSFYCLTDVLCGDGGSPPTQEIVNQYPVIVKNGGFDGEPSHRVYGVSLLVERKPS